MAHWPVLSAQALFIDDQQYVIENHLVRTPGWNSTLRFLSEVLEPSTVEGYYQPLSMISLMLDAAAGGSPDNLRPFHVTSLILHLANVALVVILIQLLFDDTLAAAAVGLLFGLHPMTVEPVAWISDRKTVLATFFALASIIFYVRHAKARGRMAYGASLAMFVLALMAKPTTTPLPLVLFLLDLWPLKRLSLRSLVEKLPFFAVAVAFGIITLISQDRTCTATMPTSYPASRIPLILCHNIVFYLQKMIWPAHASAHHTFPSPMSLSQPAVLRGVIGTVILLPLLALSLRWTRAWAVGWLVFMVAILPTMQIIGFTDVIASDKYAYWPVVGLLLPLAWLITRVAPKWVISRRRAVAVFVLLIACAEVYATRRTLDSWRTTESLYDYVIRVAPADARLRSYYAVYLSKRPNRANEALEQCLQAERLGIRDELICSNVGAVLIRIGRPDEARAFYQRLLPQFERSYSVLSNLGVLMMEQGDADDAVPLLERAIALKPLRAEPHTNLANALLNQGRLEDAIKQYRASLNVRPDIAETHNNLGVALFQSDREDEALREFDAAIGLRADYPDPHRNKALLYASRGQLPEAMVACRNALSLEPKNPLNHALMGDLLMHSNRPGDARGAYQNALNLSPGLPGAERGLAGAEAAIAAMASSQPADGP